MSGLDSTTAGLESLDDILVPIPFGMIFPPSHAGAYTIGTDQHDFTPAAVEHRRPMIPLPLPFVHSLSSDHPIATRRLWNVLSGAIGFQHRLYQLEGMLGRTYVGNTQEAMIPYVESFAVHVVSDDLSIDGTLLVVRRGGISHGVSVHDVLDTVHRECSSHAAAGGAAQGWLWGGLKASPQENTVILTLYREATPGGLQRSHPVARYHGSTRR